MIKAIVLMYSQVANKQSILVNRGVGKVLNFNKRGGGVKIKGEVWNLSNDFKWLENDG